MIRAVIFDFDGTLVLSNAIKEDSFLVLASKFQGGREQMQRILLERPGDRSAIWQRFASELGIPEQAGALVGRYTSLCQSRIETCPERTGASAVMGVLRARGLRLYVNSSTPTGPLRALTAARFAADTFDAVHGGYGRKLENLRRIAGDAQLDPVAIVMVGDGLDDREAALACGCQFVGVSGGSLAAGHAGPLIDDLRDLPDRLDSIKERIHL